MSTSVRLNDPMTRGHPSRSPVMATPERGDSEEGGVVGRVRLRHEGTHAVEALVGRLARLDGATERGDHLGHVGLAGVAFEGGEPALREPT